MKTTNFLLAILIVVLICNGPPKATSPELAKVRIEEAAKIVELYENRINDAKLRLSQEEIEYNYCKERSDRLNKLHKTGSIAEKEVVLANHQTRLAEFKVRSSAIDLRETQIELELSKIRLRAAAIDPDDLTIYLDQK